MRQPSIAAMLLFALAVAFVPLARAQDDSDRQPAAAPSVDEQLIEGLDDALFEELDMQPPDASLPGEDERAPSDTDPSGTDDDEAGEDLGAVGDEDPLSRIGRRMRRVEQRLADATVDVGTRRLQEQIVADIDELLRQARRRASQSSSPSNNNQPQETGDRTNPQQPEQSQGQADGSGGQPAQQAGEQSTERVEQGTPGEVDAADVHDLVGQVWGHLPQREREQMIQNAVDVFLPKYARLIEEYFRKLAAESAGR